MRYVSSKPIKSKLTYRQSINQSTGSTTNDSPSEKLPHGDDFRVGLKRDRTPLDNTVLEWWRCCILLYTSTMTVGVFSTTIEKKTPTDKYSKKEHCENGKRGRIWKKEFCNQFFLIANSATKYKVSMCPSFMNLHFESQFGLNNSRRWRH